MYKQSYSDKWNNNFPRCFRGENYSQDKGNLISDLRSLEGQINNLEKKLEREKNNHAESQQKIISLETQLSKTAQELNDNELRKELIEQLEKRIAENKEWFKKEITELKHKFTRNYKGEYQQSESTVYLDNVLDAQEELTKNENSSFAQKQFDKYYKLFGYYYKSETDSLLKQQKKIIELEQQLTEITIKQEIKAEIEVNSTK